MSSRKSPAERCLSLRGAGIDARSRSYAGGEAIWVVSGRPHDDAGGQRVLEAGLTVGQMFSPGRVRFESLEGRTLMSGNSLGVSTGSYLGGKQLRVAGTAGNDQITVRRTADGLLLANHGWSLSVRGSFKSIRINGGAGNDSIAIGSTVARDAILYGDDGNDTLYGGAGNDRLYGGAGDDRTVGGAGADILVSVGGGARDTLLGGRDGDSFWADPTDTIGDADSVESAEGFVHRVSGFQGSSGTGGSTSPVTVSSGPGTQNLADPRVTDTDYTYRNFSNNPLFSDAGPGADDVIQGQVGDCYLLAVLSSIAKVNPGYIRQRIVDLGDGTYAVQFVQNETQVFVRVDADLATTSDGSPAYADLGAQGSLWVALVEKAYTYIRSSNYTYKSLEAGWMSEAYDAMGAPSRETYTTRNAGALMSAISNALSAGKSVTYAVTTPKGAPLIGGHSYMVDSVVKNASGALVGLRLRNPWGTDGAGSDGSNDGYITISAAQAYASLLGFATASV